MTVAGDVRSNLIRNVWEPGLVNSVFYNSTFLGATDNTGARIFETVQAPAGSQITKGHTVSVDSNSEAYTYDDPMPVANTLTDVKPYFTKDPYQTAARVFKVNLDYMGSVGGEPGIDAVGQTLENAAKDHWDLVNRTFITDLTAQIDSASTYSDAALNRSTYTALASYETAVGGALTLAVMEDMLEAMLDNDRGGRLDDYALLMPYNQKTNLSRLGAGSGAGYNIQLAPGGTMDIGRLASLETWNGVPIVPTHDMDNSTILMVHRPSTKIYWTRQLTITEKEEAADTMLFHLTSNWNIVTWNPKMSGKLGTLTA